QTWKNSPDGKILRSDVTVAKNYMNQEEIQELNTVVNMYLDYAELQAKKQLPMSMKEWIVKLDSFLQFNEYNVLIDAGKMQKAVADAFAEKQYEEFRVVQDKEYLSDFDKLWQSRLEEIEVAYKTLHGRPDNS